MLLIRWVICVCGLTHGAPIGVEKVMDSIVGPDRLIATDVKISTYCWFVRCTTLIAWKCRMPWPKIGTTHNNAKLGLPDKWRAIKGLGSRAKRSVTRLLCTVVPWGINLNIITNTILTNDTFQVRIFKKCNKFVFKFKIKMWADSSNTKVQDVNYS